MKKKATIIPMATIGIRCKSIFTGGGGKPGAEGGGGSCALATILLPKNKTNSSSVYGIKVAAFFI